MKTLRLATVLLALTAAAAQGEVVCERWGGAPADAASTHPGTLTVTRGAPVELLFDLSAIPRDAKVLHASLACFAAGRPTQGTHPGGRRRRRRGQAPGA